MPSRFQASFIPQKSNVLSESREYVGRRMTNLLSVIVTIIFLLTLAAAIGIFLYQQLLAQRIEDMKEQIDQARAAFEPSLIEELKRLELRIEATREILDTHVALTPIFNLLEFNTLRNVRFADFHYSTNGDHSAELALDGEATAFAAIALQADLFGESRDLNDSIFSDLNPNENGLVDFSFNGAVNPRTLLYEHTLEELGSVAEPSAIDDVKDPSDPFTPTSE